MQPKYENFCEKQYFIRSGTSRRAVVDVFDNLLLIQSVTQTCVTGAKQSNAPGFHVVSLQAIFAKDLFGICGYTDHKWREIQTRSHQRFVIEIFGVSGQGNESIDFRPF